ncbi:Cytochrome b-c1 complex subunit 2 mitochondrial [Caligus rogercresseyi]|uniref:Cytochrome b-c1 complex subunit 2 mitochondrial n=1 Tax=Caligus rogercresseyi TaxID=217165 RepID=A0A7T8GTY8_CALRO|nr:Cytochrome b-c1 complex subunit 2 mitochondrial [Caligus rogercresseyi]
MATTGLRVVSSRGFATSKEGITKLPNGLSVLSVPDSRGPGLLRLAVASGSRFEKYENLGASHALRAGAGLTSGGQHLLWAHEGAPTVRGGPGRGARKGNHELYPHGITKRGLRYDEKGGNAELMKCLSSFEHVPHARCLILESPYNEVIIAL